MHGFVRRLQHTKYSKSGDTRLLVYEREGVMAYRVGTIFSYKLLKDHCQRLGSADGRNQASARKNASNKALFYAPLIVRRAVPFM